MAETRDVKLTFTDESLDALRELKGQLSDERLRLECVKLAVANNSKRFIHQLLKDASEIEAHIRFGNTKEGYVPLGPELFIGDEGEVISFKGENFFRACAKFVRKLDDGDGASHCVKRINHPGTICEDYDGETYDRKDLDL